MEGGSGVTRIIIEQLHSWDIQRVQMEDGSGVTVVLLMNFILEISNCIK